MKHSKRTALRLFLGLILACGLASIFLKQGELGRLRAEHGTLLAASVHALPPVQTNREIAPTNQDAEELQKLRAENADLPGLRNEVTQLRKQAGEAAALQAEHQRLATQATVLASKSARSPAAAPVTPFIPKTALADAGLSTPETTLKTFFWAMSQGNLTRASECSDLQMFPANAQKDVAEQMQRFQGYQILEQRQTAPDQMLVLVRAPGLNPNSDDEPIPFKRVGNEWKISAP